MKIPAAVLAASLTLLGQGRAEECRYEEERHAVLDASEARLLKVVARAGSLRIEGRSDLKRVRVEGVACAHDRDDLEKIQLITDDAGSTLRVEARLPGGSSWNWNWGHHSPKLDLVIEVPDTLPLDVRDTSGGIEIRAVGDLELDDSSGGIEVEDVRGSLVLNDSSGGIKIEQVAGDARLRDSSGRISIRDVGRSVLIERDSSGAIQISEVRGDVRIERDGSGSITVSDVGGSVNVGQDGSGSISVSRVKGDFSVGRDGSGGIDYDRVAGRVSVPHRR